MGSGFEDRARMTLEEARSVCERPTNVITHLLSNDDGTFSVMSHIVCEHCDYCDSQGDCREGGKAAVPAKDDPYEMVGR
jgi:hypothetical protein